MASMDEGQSGVGMKSFAVLGNPIEHSLSPAIHQAAYSALGLDWRYSKELVGENELTAFLDSHCGDFSGFSLTMPLKGELYSIATERGWQVDAAATRLGAANTLVLEPSGLFHVANTDLHGARRAMLGLPDDLRSAAILGAGATAHTIALALVESFKHLETLTVFARRPEAAASISTLVEHCETFPKFEWLPIEAAADFGGADITVNSLPSWVSQNVEVDKPFTPSFVFDVTYDNPSQSLAANWPAENRVDARAMLVYQAVEQLKLFGAFDAATRQVSEQEVIEAMFAAIL